MSPGTWLSSEADIGPPLLGKTLRGECAWCWPLPFLPQLSALGSHTGIV